MHYGKYYPKKEIHDSRITEQPTGKPGSSHLWKLWLFDWFLTHPLPEGPLSHAVHMQHANQWGLIGWGWSQGYLQSYIYNIYLQGKNLLCFMPLPIIRNLLATHPREHWQWLLRLTCPNRPRDASQFLSSIPGLSCMERSQVWQSLMPGLNPGTVRLAMWFQASDKLSEPQFPPSGILPWELNQIKWHT